MIFGFLHSASIMAKSLSMIFSFTTCKPPARQDQITIESVMNALKKETEDSFYTEPPVPGNKYILKLMEEGYFDDLNEENLQEINALARLLNL